MAKPWRLRSLNVGFFETSARGLDTGGEGDERERGSLNRISVMEIVQTPSCTLCWDKSHRLGDEDRTDTAEVKSIKTVNLQILTTLYWLDRDSTQGCSVESGKCLI